MTQERKDVICYWHFGTYCEAVGDAATLVLPEGARVVSIRHDPDLIWRRALAPPVDSTATP